MDPIIANLIYKISKRLPYGYKELEKYEKKITHWAWWAWPTEKEGFSEPGTHQVIHLLYRERTRDQLSNDLWFHKDTDSWVTPNWSMSGSGDVIEVSERRCFETGYTRTLTAARRPG